MRALARFVLMLPFLLLFFGGAFLTSIGLVDGEEEALVYGGIALVVGILMGCGWARTVLRYDNNEPSRREAGISATDEVRLMQELHQGLTRMEDRIEALETIMLKRGERVEAGHY
jgi:phage shock protein B